MDVAALMLSLCAAMAGDLCLRETFDDHVVDSLQELICISRGETKWLQSKSIGDRCDVLASRNTKCLIFISPLAEGNAWIEFRKENDVVVASVSGGDSLELFDSPRRKRSAGNLQRSIKIAQSVEDRPIDQDNIFIERGFSFQPHTLCHDPECTFERVLDQNRKAPGAGARCKIFDLSGLVPTIRQPRLKPLQESGLSGRVCSC